MNAAVCACRNNVGGKFFADILVSIIFRICGAISISRSESRFKYVLYILIARSGEDLLRVRLQTSNIVFGRGGSNLTDFNFAAPGDNLLQINKLQYETCSPTNHTN